MLISNSKLYHYTIIFLLVIQLQACTINRYQNPQVNVREFMTGNKALIITKLSHRFKGLVWDGEIGLNRYSLARIDDRYPDKERRFSYSSPESNVWLSPNLASKYDVLMIEPGAYALEELSYTLGSIIYSSTVDGLNPGTEHLVYGGFSVNPGEIIYLGDINVNMNDAKNMNFTVYDNFEKALYYFNKKYPQFNYLPVHKKFFITKGKIAPGSNH